MKIKTSILVWKLSREICRIGYLRSRPNDNNLKNDSATWKKLSCFIWRKENLTSTIKRTNLPTVSYLLCGEQWIAEQEGLDSIPTLSRCFFFSSWVFLSYKFYAKPSFVRNQTFRVLRNANNPLAIKLLILSLSSASLLVASLVTHSWLRITHHLALASVRAFVRVCIYLI